MSPNPSLYMWRKGGNFLAHLPKRNSSADLHLIIEHGEQVVTCNINCSIRKLKRWEHAEPFEKTHLCVKI